MMDYTISAHALADLDEIWTYYAESVGDLDLADQVKFDLFAAIDRLANFPGIGHRRSDLFEERALFWKVHSYLIVYEVRENELKVVRIIHGARDVARILRPEDED